MPLTLSGAGTLTLQTGNPVTVTVTGGALAPGDYKLIAKGASGTVSSYNIGNCQHAAVFQHNITLSSLAEEHFLHVAATSPPSQLPRLNAASSINSSGFTVNWNAVGGATGYKLDVSSVNDFSSFVSGYDDLDASGTSQVLWD